MNFDIAPSGGSATHHLHPPPDPSTVTATAPPHAAPQTSAAAAHVPGATPTPANTAPVAATATAAPSATAAPTSSGTPDSRSATFQAVDGGAETRSGETLLVEAYAVIWILLMGWLVFLWRKQALLTTRLDDLERAIDRAAAKSSKTSG
jgi:hypothetical protein